MAILKGARLMSYDSSRYSDEFRKKVENSIKIPTRIYADFTKLQTPKVLESEYSQQVQWVLKEDGSRLACVPTQSLIDQECIARKGSSFVLHYCHCQLLAVTKKEFLSGRYRLFFSHGAKEMVLACYKKYWLIPHDEVDRILTDLPQELSSRSYTVLFLDENKVYLFADITIPSFYSQRIYESYLSKQSDNLREAKEFQRLLSEQRLEVIEDISNYILSHYDHSLEKHTFYINGSRIGNRLAETSRLFVNYGLKDLENSNQCYGLALAVAHQLSGKIPAESQLSVIGPDEVVGFADAAIIHLEIKRPKPVLNNWV